MTLSSYTWPKILAAVVVAVIVGVFLLFQFTSFQIPENLIGGKPAATADDYKLNLGEDSTARNNLDEVHDIIHGKKQMDSGSGTSTEEGGHADQ